MNNKILNHRNYNISEYQKTKNIYIKITFCNFFFIIIIIKYINKRINSKKITNQKHEKKLKKNENTK